MSEQLLELIKTRTLILKEGFPSGEVVLVDDTEGDMFFTFLLKYVSEESVGNTHFEVIDGFHAKMTVDTRPNAFTRLKAHLEIGTYQLTRKLYMDIAVDPCFNQEEHEHRVTVFFYTDKAKVVEDGTK